MDSTIPMGTMDESGNVDGKPFIEWFRDAEAQAQGSSAVSYGRDRPYNGQPHTDFGVRGATLVAGLTFRDVMDCFIRAMMDCLGDVQPELYEIRDRALWNDMYRVKDMNRIDPGAWQQNLSVRMEKMMGTYPNVPPLTDDGGEVIA